MVWLAFLESYEKIDIMSNNLRKNKWVCVIIGILFYFGFNKVSVQKEEIYEGYEVELVRIMPFLYTWERELKESIFRVTIGNEKYYYTIVST